MISLGYVPINDWVKQNAINWKGQEFLVIIFGGWILYDFVSKRF